jgi:hypothetical protein
MSEPVHDPPVVFDALGRREVDYVTVGGLAVGFWGHVRATKDTDIVVPDIDPDNDARLQAALVDLLAEPLALAAPGAAALGIAWRPEGDVERWQTAGGTLDVMRSPEGAPPYEQLRARALQAELLGARTVVVSREDLIAMKLAAARIQDLLDLDALLDPRNTEADRAALRADDRARLQGDSETAELGAAVDPCEHEVDGLRRVLAPSGARAGFERELVRRGRELRTVGERRLAELARTPLAAIPPGVERTAAAVAQAARAVDAVEEREFSLLRERERERVGRWRRRDRQILNARLEQATTNAESLRDQADSGVDQLRADMGTIASWWEQNGKLAVDGIAARRERYRRDRALAAERVRQAPEQPAGYVTQLIGERPAKRVVEWSVAARCIEAYAAQYHHGEGPLTPPQSPARAQHGAWERMARATRQIGIEPPALDERSHGSGLDAGI